MWYDLVDCEQVVCNKHDAEDLVQDAFIELWKNAAAFKPERALSIPEPKFEHHEGRGIRSCPIFPNLRPILDEAVEIFGDNSEYVVAAPQYRAAANTAMGWKNASLRSETLRLLRRAGVSPWPRLFHSMRASRLTELQREFLLHVVCSRLGNSPRIAQQSYLLVTEDDFAKAAGLAKDRVRGWWCGEE